MDEQHHNSKKELHVLLLPNQPSTLIPEVSQGFGEGKGSPQSCKIFDEIGTKGAKEGSDEIVQ